MLPTITARLKTLIAIMAIALLAGFGAPATQAIAQETAATEAAGQATDTANQVEEETDDFDDWGLLGLLGLLGLGGLLKKNRDNHTVTATRTVEPHTRVVERDVDVDTTRRV